MRKKDPVVAIRKWLKKPGNKATRLAAELGYKSSSTISAWLSKGVVPDRAVDALMKILGK